MKIEAANILKSHNVLCLGARLPGWLGSSSFYKMFGTFFWVFPLECKLSSEIRVLSYYCATSSS